MPGEKISRCLTSSNNRRVVPFAAQQIRRISGCDGLAVVGVIAGTLFESATLSLIVEELTTDAVTARQAVVIRRQPRVTASLCLLHVTARPWSWRTVGIFQSERRWTRVSIHAYHDHIIISSISSRRACFIAGPTVWNSAIIFLRRQTDKKKHTETII